MSTEDRDIDSITLRVAGLEIEVRRARGSTEPDLGFEVVEPPSEASAEQTLDQAVLDATTPGALQALDLPHLEPFARALTSCGEWSAQARVARAYRAGLSARQCQDQSLYCPLPSPTLPGLKNCIYIILTTPKFRREAGLASIAYSLPPFGGQRGRLDKKALCHAFASQAETDSYLSGAGRRWPPMLEG